MNTLILLSGGIGSRMKMGEFPKQYIEFHGKPIINYSLETFDKHNKVDKIVIVAAPEWRRFIDKQIKASNIKKFYMYADPGRTRQFSIINGLDVLRADSEENDIVIIHDAARPLVSPELIDLCTEIGNYDGVLPVLPVKDTYYYSEDAQKVEKLLKREYLFAGQAPESFYLKKYINANDQLSESELLKINGTTEVAVKAGLNIQMIPGEEKNFKITTKNDLELFEMYMASKE